jgi:uncharacterized protein
MKDDGVARLEAIIRATPWMLRVLGAARAAAPPGWWVGGGVLRDLVWDRLHGHFDPARVKDVDLAFYDPADLSHAREVALEHALAAHLPSVAWDAKNQAAVRQEPGCGAHLVPGRFGARVAPLDSAAAGVATWPETATAVAVRLHADDGLEVLAPCGLADLLDGVCRRNPCRVTVEEYRRRLVRKRVPERWPKVVIIDP